MLQFYSRDVGVYTVTSDTLHVQATLQFRCSCLPCRRLWEQILFWSHLLKSPWLLCWFPILGNRMRCRLESGFRSKFWRCSDIACRWWISLCSLLSDRRVSEHVWKPALSRQGCILHCSLLPTSSHLELEKGSRYHLISETVWQCLRVGRGQDLGFCWKHPEDEATGLFLLLILKPVWLTMFALQLLVSYPFIWSLD